MCDYLLLLFLLLRLALDDGVLSAPSRWEFSSPGRIPSENITERLESLLEALLGPTVQDKIVDYSLSGLSSTEGTDIPPADCIRIMIIYI